MWWRWRASICRVTWRASCRPTRLPVLKEAGHQTEFIDPIAEEIAPEQLREKIRNLDSDLIGIPVFTTTYTLAKKLAAEIRTVNPRVKILLGGPHCSGFPGETLKEIDADFVIFGEGEYATLNLLTALEKGTDLAAIENLVYRKNGEIIRNKAAEFIKDLDALPLPDRDGRQRHRRDVGDAAGGAPAEFDGDFRRRSAEKGDQSDLQYIQVLHLLSGAMLKVPSHRTVCGGTSPCRAGGGQLGPPDRQRSARAMAIGSAN